MNPSLSVDLAKRFNRFSPIFFNSITVAIAAKGQEAGGQLFPARALLRHSSVHLDQVNRLTAAWKLHGSGVFLGKAQA
jgi:hypothetical protein